MGKPYTKDFGTCEYCYVKNIGIVWDNRAPLVLEGHLLFELLDENKNLISTYSKIIKKVFENKPTIQDRNNFVDNEIQTEINATKYELSGYQI